MKSKANLLSDKKHLHNTSSSAIIAVITYHVKINALLLLFSNSDREILCIGCIKLFFFSCIELLTEPYIYALYIINVFSLYANELWITLIIKLWQSVTSLKLTKPRFTTDSFDLTGT
jgi:hypothetical protein